MEAAPIERSPAKSVCVIGLGVIGSHLVPHVGRLHEVGSVKLVDPQAYEVANLATQEITSRDPGKPKVAVQAQRLREINPALNVVALATAVEKVPRGDLRADVLLSCLDSRHARQHVNLAARRLGIPWIDAGVEASSCLVRITVYFPGEGPCMECCWDERDYAAVEQIYTCRGEPVEEFSTGAPSSLGALAATLQALELSELFGGRVEDRGHGRQVVLDSRHHRVFVTRFARNPHCRIADHAVWEIERLSRGPGEMTLGDALGLAPQGSTGSEEFGLRMEGASFVSRLTCSGCRESRSLLELDISLRAQDLRCRHCGENMHVSGFHSMERLGPSSMPDEWLDRSLDTLGVRPGDVLSVGRPGRERHVEMGGAP